MSQTQVFHATANVRLSISRTAYLSFAIGASILVCAATMIALSFTGEDAPRSGLLTVSIGLICAGAAGLLGGLVTLFRLRQSIQVEVSPHRMIWREGRKVAVMEYNELERADLVKVNKRVRGGHQMAYPIVRFIENDGEVIEFDVSFEDRGLVHRSRFDALAIAHAVLHYVGNQVLVAPALDEFIQTGLVDIDSLPER